jgi:hypothetical protein
MAFAEHYMITGLTTAAQSATLPATINVNCGFLPSRVVLTNETQYGSLATGFKTIQNLWWDATNPTVTKLQYLNASGTGLLPGALASNTGISLYDGHAASPNQLQLGAKITGSNTAKATGVFTVSSTASLYAGATILMTGNTVNKQLAGMMFTVNSVIDGTTFNIANAGWLNTANFTNGAETFYVQLVLVPGLYYPQNAQIVSISQANPAVVTTSTNTNLTVGQQVRLYVPSVFGMTQANFVTGVVSAVSGNQITLGGANMFGVNNGVNSSAYTAFAWPAATAVPFSPATMVPMGSGPYPVTTNAYLADTLLDATINTAYQGFVINTGILVTASSTVIGVVASDVFSWTAWRADV